jgi:hypothetical protein
MQRTLSINHKGLISVVALLGIFLVPVARAAVTLPGGDTLLNGGFDEINYGDTGLAYVTPFLYTGDLAVTESPSDTANTTDLTYGYSFSGLGSPLTTIRYTIGNTGPATFSDLRFIVDVQPDGSGSFNDQRVIVPNPWAAAAAGDPDQYQVADFISDDLSGDIVLNNGLDGSDTCGGNCDVEFALQWNLAQILPGEIWNIVVGLSDDGQSLSSRYLQAVSVDTLNTELTFSGQASVVPLPASFVFMASALAGLFGFSRRKREAI